MNYNDLALFAFGFGGVILHSLIKIQELKDKKKFAASEYFSQQWPTMCTSALLVVLCILGKHDFAMMAYEKAALPASVAMITIGYSGQSIFKKLMQFLQKKLTPKEDNS